MKPLRLTFLFVLLFFMVAEGIAQVTSVPGQAKENFAKQYPDAENVEWDNDIIHVNVRFRLGDDEMNAEYNNKGVWKSTLKESNYEDLPTEVKDGFMKSKFAGRDISDVKVVYLPGNIIQYRLKAEKNDVQKKFLWFNDRGRLIRDSNTL